MRLNRRYFLKLSGAVSAYLGCTPLELLAENCAEPPPAKPVRKGKTLVIVFLRGGADGLNLVIPYRDPNYARMRRAIRIGAPSDTNPAGRAIDLDGTFGLHPRLRALHPLFKSGDAVALHAVGHDRNTRSHFEEQDVWETGVIGNTLNSDGWVNRHLVTSTGHGPIRAVAIGDTLPRIMQGKYCAYAVQGIDDLTIPDGGAGRTALTQALEHAYKPKARKQAGEARDLLAQTGQATLEGVEQLRKLVGRPYTPAAPYPNTDLARQLMQGARLIKADVGLEVLEVDYGGWDTHQHQGGADGPYANLAQGLAEALAAFHQDLGERAADVLTITLSDFGRTAEENGTFGTDHGWANCLFAIGAGVKRSDGKMVLGRWPGLAPDQLHERRDLMHTTDFRDVIAEAVRVHLGNAALGQILPHYEPKAVGLVTA